MFLFEITQVLIVRSQWKSGSWFFTFHLHPKKKHLEKLETSAKKHKKRKLLWAQKKGISLWPASFQHQQNAYRVDLPPTQQWQQEKIIIWDTIETRFFLKLYYELIFLEDCIWLHWFGQFSMFTFNWNYPKLNMYLHKPILKATWPYHVLNYGAGVWGGGWTSSKFAEKSGKLCKQRDPGHSNVEWQNKMPKYDENIVFFCIYRPKHLRALDSKSERLGFRVAHRVPLCAFPKCHFKLKVNSPQKSQSKFHHQNSSWNWTPKGPACTAKSYRLGHEFAQKTSKTATWAQKEVSILFLPSPNSVSCYPAL